MSSNTHHKQKSRKSELEKFTLFFEELPNAHPVSGRLRRNKAIA